MTQPNSGPVHDEIRLSSQRMSLIADSEGTMVRPVTDTPLLSAGHLTTSQHTFLLHWAYLASMCCVHVLCVGIVVGGDPLMNGFVPSPQSTTYTSWPEACGTHHLHLERGWMDATPTSYPTHPLCLSGDGKRPSE